MVDFGSPAKNCIAVVKFNRNERRDEIGSYCWTEQMTNVFQTAQLEKKQVPETADELLHCQLSVEQYDHAQPSVVE
jgi:hypothetical protein